MLVDSLYYSRKEKQKLQIILGGFAGGQQIHAGIRGKRPVVVLAGAVEPGEGLLVQQAYHAVAECGLFHYFHHQLVVVRSGVGVCKYRRQLVLAGSHFLVLRLGEYAQLPKLGVKIPHEIAYPGGYGAIIMIVHLLPLWGFCPKEGAGAEDEIRPLVVKGLFHKEILLLCAGGGYDLLHILVAEQLEYAKAFPVDEVHGAQQRGLFIQSVSAVRKEQSGYAQRGVLYECVAGGIPCGVAPGLKGGPEAA